MTSRKLHSRQRAVRRSVQCDDFVTQAIIANTMHQNGSLPDVLFSTEGKNCLGTKPVPVDLRVAWAALLWNVY